MLCFVEYTFSQCAFVSIGGDPRCAGIIYRKSDRVITNGTRSRKWFRTLLMRRDEFRCPNVALGVLALGAGLGDFTGINLPLFPICLVIIGATLILKR